MKSVIINQNGGPEVLEFVENFPEPQIKNNEVLINIKATSLNRVDLTIRKGYPGLSLNFPHILGGDIAGVVVQLGENVKDIKINQRAVIYPVVLPEIRDPHYGENEYLNEGWQFFGMQRNGSYAEYIAVPAENVISIPDNLSYEDAAAIPIAGLTAYHSIFYNSVLDENKTFFIWGGASGLGTYAIQLAKMTGATVITTVGKDDKKEALYELGADYVFNHHKDNLVEEVKKIAPKGIDLLIDYVGPATFDKSFAMLRRGAKLVLCGMLTGLNVNLNIQQTYFRHINIQGIYLGNKQEFFRLVEYVAEGKIKSKVHSIFHLKEAQLAHKLMESGNYVGKIVLIV